MSELKVTSPEEYEAITATHPQVFGELVPLPSGMVVRARRVDIEGQALIGGGLPMSLVAAAQKLRAIGNEEDAEELTDEDTEKTKRLIDYMRKMTQDNTIEPALTTTDTAGGEVKVVWEWPSGVQREVLTEDFKVLSAWIRGEEVDGLDSFRNRKTRRAHAAKPRSKALRSQAELDAERMSPTA